MGKSSWVCFDCRQIMRRPTHTRAAVPCSRCGRPARCVGHKVRLPVREDKAGWSRLRARLAAERRSAGERAVRERVRERHALERELKELESRPANKGRVKAAQLLRRRL